jgi:hypothetical protein
MSNTCQNSNSFFNAYNNEFDQLGYIGPRTQYDIDLQNMWNQNRDYNSCNSSSVNNYSNNVSNSLPMPGYMMRTDYDNNLRNTFAPNMNTCGIKNANIQNISYSVPSPMYQGFRTDYDLSMKNEWNRNTESCSKENFSYGLSFNDQNNIYSYTGNMNCDATCNSYPIPVSSCGNNFDIVKINSCNNCNTCNNMPVNNCNGYLFQ